MITKDLGMVTAYAYAVSKGYTGTEEEFAELMASYASVAQEAVDAALAAAQSAQNAQDAKTAAEGARDTAQNTVDGAIAGIQAEGQTQIGAVQSEGATQVGNVNSAGQTQVGNVNAAGTTQVGNVNTAGSTQVGAVQAKGTEVLNSIPADYSTLSGDVSGLKSAINNRIPVSGESIINDITQIPLDWESGTITNGSDQPNTNCIRTKGYLCVFDWATLKINQTAADPALYISEYDKDQVFLHRYAYYAVGDHTPQESECKFIRLATYSPTIPAEQHNQYFTAYYDNQYSVSKLYSTISKDYLYKKTARIFKKVVCVGDSYTEGWLKVEGDSERTLNPDYAWPHYMSDITGNHWLNCGVSGATTLYWLTVSNGLTKAQSLGVSQAYVIGLMINDTGSVPLGTSADIGTDSPTTYYGGLAKIIRELAAISPNAHIFVNTCPKTDGSYADFNNAVREVVNAYKNTYKVYCIDLSANASLYDALSFTGDAINGHYTAIGYEQMAEIYCYLLSEYINNHISTFQDVYKLPFDPVN